ncbi:NAD(P)-binding protein [Pseudovirgaria hyperparasitica]|uniref:NAD(P)-binding protein n=1 Tax=Pseudovirgaria hyperparasitica TaxID=470096 RepID=A0A6A6W025_9PEZI|nr:NAD(P)-binding protein [Pseudovirgaria hyperparasitica]KAF2755334.1 NAD(P)-binding protein [Pseudovirgaria hyperparasitica]
MAPSTQQQWTVEGKDGFDSLKFTEDAEVPKPGPNEVLIKFHAASLNYRDLIIPKGMYPFGQRDGVVPASDGAGVVDAVGEKVTRFKIGDNVTTLFNAGHLAGALDPISAKTGLGGLVDGALRQYGAYNEQSVVAAPQNLNFMEAATLPCAGLTAWNALYGITGKQLKAGDWVLTQGTGGVSIFALQFAKAAGARVISTTSSAEKTQTLKQLGADHVINYKENPNWGEEAAKIAGGGGVHHILEVGGPTTMAQSLKAIRMEGTISIIGFLGGGKAEKQPTFLDALTNVATIRGLLVGSRLQFEEMNAAIEANNIKPVVDEKVFGLEQAKEAYQYMWDQKHFGKLTIKIA